MYRPSVLAACVLVAACAGTVKEGMAAGSRSLVPWMLLASQCPQRGVVQPGF
jgi:hypothetical protein